MIEDYDVKGNRGGKQAFLQAFDDDTRTRLLAYRDGRNAGKTHSTAASEARRPHLEEQRAEPARARRAGLRAGQGQRDLIAKIEPKGLFAQVWEKMPFPASLTIRRWIRSAPLAVACTAGVTTRN